MNRENSSFELPLLNQGVPYVPEIPRVLEDDEDISFDAESKINKRIHMNTQRFEQIYRDTMRFFTEQERLQYRQYMAGQRPKEEFFKDCAKHLTKNHEEMKNQHDFNVMMDRINLSIFGYDVIQPLIDHPDTTDIKICSPTDIRVRVKGKACKSNATFMDERDLNRFIDSLALKNQVNIEAYPVVTFADKHDPNYILRFTISNRFINSVDYPYLHIRKISKSKPDFDKLIEDGMMNENIKAYLIDRAKNSKGIVFAGPPGSGKTTALNAFIEYIPRSRETLVIQENDELYTNQSGFMFKHISHGFSGEPIFTLEDLGKMALVEGCNEFIIGEVKGGEMRYAMTLLNAGGYTGLTVHSTNAYETLDKLADLVKYGSSYTFEEARHMLRTLDTIVYMEGYKVIEILEVDGYDNNLHQYNYINIYRYGVGNERKGE